jgi:hypothetical protein
VWLPKNFSADIELTTTSRQNDRFQGIGAFHHIALQTIIFVECGLLDHAAHYGGYGNPGDTNRQHFWRYIARR